MSVDADRSHRPVLSVSMSADGTTLISGSLDKTVRVPSGCFLLLRASLLVTLLFAMHALLFRTVIGLDSCWAWQGWDVDDGASAFVLPGHSSLVRTVHCPQHNADLAFSGSADCTIKVRFS